MPLSVEDLIARSNLGGQRAQASAQGRVAQQAPNTPEPQAPPPAAVAPMTAPEEQPQEQGEPGIIGQMGSAYMRAARENVVDPALRLARGHSQGTMGTVSDIAQTGTHAVAGAALLASPFVGGSALKLAATIEAPNLAQITVQGTVDALGGGKDTHQLAQILGSAAGMLAGGVQLFRGVRAGAAAGASAAAAAGKEAEALPGVAGSFGWQRVGQQLRQGVVGGLAARKKPLSTAIEKLENGLMPAGEVDASMPVYHEIEKLVDEGVSRQVTNPAFEKIHKAVTNIDKTTGNNAPLPVKPSDVVELRRSLQQSGGARNALDPNMPASAASRGVVHDQATRVVQTLMGAQDGLAYRTTLDRYAQEYAGPARILRAITSKNTTPATAFEKVYTAKDPTVIQTVAELSAQSPELRAKLKLGFLESLRMASGGALKAADGKTTKAAELLERSGDSLQALGVFSPKEMVQLKLALKGGWIDAVSPGLSTALGARGRRFSFLTGGGGAVAALHYMTGMGLEPAIMLAIAGGAVSQVRTLAMVPPTSAQAASAAAAIVRAATETATSLMSQDVADLDEPGDPLQ